jgi:hypothetical protein
MCQLTACRLQEVSAAAAQLRYGRFQSQFRPSAQAVSGAVHDIEAARDVWLLVKHLRRCEDYFAAQQPLAQAHDGSSQAMVVGGGGGEEKKQSSNGEAELSFGDAAPTPAPVAAPGASSKGVMGVLALSATEQADERFSHAALIGRIMRQHSTLTRYQVLVCVRYL